ncbi:MAG TPA: SDR family oxidoreductase [Methanomassiliicoccales archaeon]|jgi:NAD(P)-dependent dehydrogenase (short-subunit alcohol dehydrogenase family)
MLIESSKLSKNALADEVAIVTGSGRGIGFETARALLWLGAKVVIAEIDEANGRIAAEKMEAEFGKERVIFTRTDVGDEGSITQLVTETRRSFGSATVVINNATIFPMGPVVQVPIESWDRSYRVNLRGPVLMARAFLPEMIRSKHGTFVCVSSSGAAPFMGAYEVFKTSQVELSNTISAEIDGTGVNAFTIGPGIVPTPGFLDGGGQVASFMGLTTEELLNVNRAALLTIEEAGVGFAGSVAMADKYHGKEVSSIQVLKDMGIEPAGIVEEIGGPSPSALPKDLLDKVVSTYREQTRGWKSRNLFERQWVARDFRKHTGFFIDEMDNALSSIQADQARSLSTRGSATLRALRKYYLHQAELLKGFEKDPKKVEDALGTIRSWVLDIEALIGPAE